MELISLFLKGKIKVIDTPSYYIFMAVFMSLLMIPYANTTVTVFENKAKANYERKLANYIDLAKWAKRNIPKDALVSCRKPLLFNFFSNRHAVNFKNTRDIEDQLEDMKSKGVDYVVLDQMGFSTTFRYLYPAYKKYPFKFKTIKTRSSPSTYLSQFFPELGYFGEHRIVTNYSEQSKDSLREFYREGTGKFVFENGQIFEGEWKNNIKHGPGVFYPIIVGTDYRLEAVWVNDTLDGLWPIKNSSGELIEYWLYEKNSILDTIQPEETARIESELARQINNNGVLE